MSYCRGEDNQWSCRKAGMVNLQKVGSIVRDIGDPCLHQSPIQVTRMLKADKWQAAFDSDGRVFGFHKALKLIILGGVDQSVRPEVWEFLLGCYALSSTAEYRKQLRSARRERYEVLVKQCQRMHSSIGTGSLAYVVGSKIMDMRKLSKEGRRQTETENKQASDVDTNKLNSYSIQPNISREISYIHQRESFSDSADLVSVRESIDSAAYDISSRVPFSCPCNCSSQEQGREVYDSHNEIENYFDFPQLPVANLFGNSEECGFHEGSIGTSIPVNSEIEVVHSEVNKPAFRYNSAGYNTDIFNRSTISQAQETTDVNATTTRQGAACDDKVAAWLWTLHRIVVDVVRTDSHLEFYENTRNLARMSDILAVYAWVDPATGYCQGMSDLLSPFVVLFEDDADAFWCFEMLIRRMRENFLIEGPTGVMKQLQTLWYILELTDREMFSHLSNIGAESLHFAFRMLLVLFRRELSFDEALCMWEMIWAADFDESVAYNFESCLEPLMVHLPRDLYPENGDESGDGNGSSHYKHGNGEHVERSLSVDTGLKSAPAQAFCGLARSFWSRNDHMHICNVISSGRYGDDELPVFCVAAILVINRHKIIKRTHSLDDLIKIFNDKILKINVKRCVRTAIRLRRKYFYKLIRKSSAARNSE